MFCLRVNVCIDVENGPLIICLDEFPILVMFHIQTFAPGLLRSSWNMYGSDTAWSANYGKASKSPWVFRWPTSCRIFTARIFPWYSHMIYISIFCSHIIQFNGLKLETGKPMFFFTWKSPGFPVPTCFNRCIERSRLGGRFGAGAGWKWKIARCWRTPTLRTRWRTLADAGGRWRHQGRVSRGSHGWWSSWLGTQLCLILTSIKYRIDLSWTQVIGVINQLS